jgi:hypothetical protein
MGSTLKNEKSLNIDLSPLIRDQIQKILKSSFYTLKKGLKDKKQLTPLKQNNPNSKGKFSCEKVA